MLSVNKQTDLQQYLVITLVSEYQTASLCSTVRNTGNENFNDKLADSSVQYNSESYSVSVQHANIGSQPEEL